MSRNIHPIISISSRIFKLGLYLASLVISGLFLLGAYSYYIPPVRWIIPAFLGLFFPVLALLQFLLTGFWLLTFDWRRILLVLGVWLIALPACLTYFPINKQQELPQEREESLHILSYNVCAFGFKPHSKRSPNPILQYIKSSGADLVCLQEAMLNQNPEAGVVSKTIHDYLKEDYPHINVLSVNGNGSTLVLLSKYPIRSAREIPLESVANGAAAYTVSIRGEEVLVINVHLESFRLKKADGIAYIELARRGEALQLKDALQGKLGQTFVKHNLQANRIHELIKSHPNGRVIVCGDFNDTPLSYAHHKIAQGLTDAFCASGNGLGISFYNRPFVVRIDHILYGAAYQSTHCFVDRSALESDHYPIQAYLQLR